MFTAIYTSIQMFVTDFMCKSNWLLYKVALVVFFKLYPKFYEHNTKVIMFYGTRETKTDRFW